MHTKLCGGTLLSAKNCCRVVSIPLGKQDFQTRSSVLFFPSSKNVSRRKRFKMGCLESLIENFLMHCISVPSFFAFVSLSFGANYFFSAAPCLRLLCRFRFFLRRNYVSRHTPNSLESGFCAAGMHLFCSRGITFRCHAVRPILHLLRFNS